MKNKLIYSVIHKGVKYNVVIKETVYKGLEMEFYNCVQNKYLYDTWKNGNTLEECLEKWYEVLERNGDTIITR